MNLNNLSNIIVLSAIFTIVCCSPIKLEQNFKDIEPGVMENLEGMYKSYDDDDIDNAEEYDFELNTANSHGLGYYKLESEPIYLPDKEAGLFDKFPKFDLFDKFHKSNKFDSYESPPPPVKPFYDDGGHYHHQLDVVAVPVKLKKCGLFGCKFSKFDKY